MALMSSPPIMRAATPFSRRVAAVGLFVALVGGDVVAARASFTDATAASGITATHGYTIVPSVFPENANSAGGVGAGDYDRDGLVDLCVVRGEHGAPVLYRNIGNLAFADASGGAGEYLASLTTGLYSSATFADVDGDGWLDLLLLGIRGTPPKLLRNAAGGGFTPIEDSGLSLPVNNMSAAFGDIDRDGDLDLFVTHWFSELLAPAGYLWRNDGSGHFVDVSQAAGLPIFSGTLFYAGQNPFLDVSYTGNFADIDSDGWPDLLVAVDFGGSRIFRNRRDGTFEEIASPGVPNDENGMGSAIGDFDGDGDLDWFVTAIWDPDGMAEANWGITGNRLYRNDGSGRFEDVSATAGVREGYWGWGASFADLDADGDLDIAHVNGWDYPNFPELTGLVGEFVADPTRIFLSNGNGTFTESAAAIGASVTDNNRGIVAFDGDRDGDIDLFLTNNDGAPTLLRNDGPVGNSLTVRIRALGPNTEGIGARVFATIGGVTQMRELRAGSNYVSQDPAEAFFGLGGAESVDQLRIQWPDGRLTSLANVAKGFLSVAQPVEGAPDCTDPSPANLCTPGSRPGVAPTSISECLLEWRVARDEVVPGKDGFPSAAVVCTEGDPACDRGGSPDTCLFDVAACLNNADPRLPSCPRGEPTRLEIRSPRATSRAAHERAINAGLSVALGALGLGSDTVRSSIADDCRSLLVAVPLKKTRNGLKKPARVTLELKLLVADRRNDSDKLTLTCNPRP